MVIYIQLLRRNRKWDSRKQLRVRANIHTLTATCGKSRKWVRLERSAVPIYVALEPCFHTTLNLSYETSPALFWSVTLCLATPVARCVGMCRFSCEIPLFIHIPFSTIWYFWWHFTYFHCPSWNVSVSHDVPLAIHYQRMVTWNVRLNVLHTAERYFMCLSGKWDIVCKERTQFCDRAVSNIQGGPLWCRGVHCRVSNITSVFCSVFCHDSLSWW